MTRVHYGRLAALFAYPDAGYRARARAIAAELAEPHPEAARELMRFLELLPSELAAMEELYLRTYDVQAITTLDVGYVLFGDDYKRGELLSHLNREHQRAGNDCGSELADHLPNVLRLVAALPVDDEIATELVMHILGPALRRMLAEFDPERMHAKREHYREQHKTLIEGAEGRSATAHRLALASLYRVLDAEFDLALAGADSTEPEPSRGFLDSVRDEARLDEGPAPSRSPRTLPTLRGMG